MTEPLVVTPPPAGVVLRAATLARAIANGNFLIDKPAAALYSKTVQSIPDDTMTSLTFDTERVDDDPAGTGGHSTSTNTSRYTAVYAGWYRVKGRYSYAANATGFRAIQLAKNGTALEETFRIGSTPTASISQSVETSALVFLDVGDYVEVQGQQTSGGDLNTDTSNAHYPLLVVTWDRIE